MAGKGDDGCVVDSEGRKEGWKGRCEVSGRELIVCRDGSGR